MKRRPKLGAKQREPTVTFALCLERPADCGDLHPATLYRVIVDRAALREGMLRIVDDSGDDYLYPREWFVLRRLPQSLSRRLRANRSGKK